MIFSRKEVCSARADFALLPAPCPLADRQLDQMIMLLRDLHPAVSAQLAPRRQTAQTLDEATEDMEEAAPAGKRAKSAR